MRRGVNGLDRAEQAARLTVDPGREVERVRVAAGSAVAEHQCPQPGIEYRIALGIGERAKELAGRGIEGVDLAEAEGEVADKQVADELAEGRRPQGEANWLPTTSWRMKLPLVSKIATAPCPGVAEIWAARPAGA